MVKQSLIPALLVVTVIQRLLHVITVEATKVNIMPAGRQSAL